MSSSKKSGTSRRLVFAAATATLVTLAVILYPSRRESPPPRSAPSQHAIASTQEAPPAVSSDNLVPQPEQQPSAELPALQRATPLQPLIPASPLVETHRTSTPAATTTTLRSAIATPSPDERTLLEKIPSARFREDLLSLAPAARAAALKALAAKPIPDADYDSLYLTQKGMLYYVCSLLPADSDTVPPASLSTPATTPPGSAAAAVPIAQPPVRHSRPGAKNTLFLDFGGMDIAGTAWNEKTKDSPAVATYHAKPYDLDGDTTTFSDAEQLNIIEIWERVAEDFSAYDVDVTTEKPAVFTRTTGHALITSATDSSGQTMPAGDKAGGVALLNQFGELSYVTRASPAFIYYDKLSRSNANIAYAVSHELGHNLGLSHDGGPGTPTTDDEYGYYQGHGIGATSWAPIMGAGYGNKVIQWSKGDYYGANNHEDDLAIIEGKLGYRDNLGSGAPATAASLTPDKDGLLGATGIIRHTGDVHYYFLNLGSTIQVNLKLDPFRLSRDNTIVGSADLKLEILNASGANYSTNNPSDTLNALINTTLPAGQWYLRVTGVGTGSPMSSNPTGFTDYGSIGQYTLTTNLVLSNPTLAIALNPNLTWKPGPLSDADWFGQRATTNDGVAAAQSGTIAAGQTSSLMTTIDGPGTFTFYWKTTALAPDQLTFFVSDSPDATPRTTVATLTASQGWQQYSFTNLVTTPRQIGWAFARSSTLGTAAAYIDQVVWTPTGGTFNTTPSTRDISADTGQFSIAIETAKTWTATAGVPWLTLSSTTGSGNATLAVTYAPNDTLYPRSGIVTITSAGINRTTEVVQPVMLPLATALNNTLTWDTGGDAPWTTQTFTTHDNQHAARSGIIFGAMQSGATTGQQTWLQTTVPNPGLITFWWKVSSEEESTDAVNGTWGDILHFYVDNIERTRTSGEKDWKQRTFTITGTGAHTLKWLYKKDPAYSGGADAAWLDQVTWGTGTAATLNLNPDSKKFSSTANQATITVDTTDPWTASTSASWLSVSPASGTGAANLNIACLVNTSTTSRIATLTVRTVTLTDTCTITQAGFVPTTSGSSNNNNNNNNNNGEKGGGGGGGALSLWTLAALTLLLALRLRKR